MGFWLIKTEPSVYSYDSLEREGNTVWDGVTNNLALMHLRSMKKGDLALVYHSGEQKMIVGVAEIQRNPYPDPLHNDPKLMVVTLKAKERLTRSIPLSEIKQRKEFAPFELVRLPRLSVMPVTSKLWSA
ncbi:MAG: EVE domain-containing protein, partial [Ignavibacteriales bacterium]|nr:EVE domain-containing protein [Ignavibacteriales bacterium]